MSCAKCGQAHPRCKGHNARGTPCGVWPIEGSDNCRIHQGGPNARAMVALRALAREAQRVIGFEPLAEVSPDIDLVEHVLRLIAQSAARAEAYAGEIRRMIDAAPSLRDAVIGDTMAADVDGSLRKAGEFIRGLTRLEAEERERSATWSFKALAIGIEAKRVEAAAAQGSQIAAVLAVVRAHPALALTDEQRAAFGGVVREVLGLTVTGSSMREIEGEHG